MLEITSEKEINTRLSWVDDIDSEGALFKGRSYIIAKRVLDVTVVLASLPFLAPIILVTIVCLKISEPRYPLFFKHLRTGKGGKRFVFYKFRTMVPHAEDMKMDYEHLNYLKWPDFKIENDPRVTPIGKIIRKYSLDELPQLLNVLKGDMSLVGPRPTSINPEKYNLWQTRRFEVLPGITGIWQLEGRAATFFDTRIRLDIAYVQKRCLWLDIQILFRTVGSVVRQRGSF